MGKLSAIFLSFFVLFCCTSKSVKQSFKDKNFLRKNFQIIENKMGSKLQFNRNKFTWTGGDLPEGKIIGQKKSTGVGIQVKTKGILSLSLNLKGKRGIYFSVFGRGFKQDFNIKIELLKDDRVIYQTDAGKMDSKNRYFKSISRVLEFTGNEKIRIEAKGNGVLLSSQLLAYKIIPKEQRKYIFVMALDNCRKDVINKYINGINITPNIQKLMKDSVSFSKAFSQSSWTFPSFLSMFSGLYEHNLDLNDFKILSPDKPYLIEQIAQDFITFSLNGGVWLSPRYGNSRGFDKIQSVGVKTTRGSGKKLLSYTMDFLKKTAMPDMFFFLHTFQIHSPFTPVRRFAEKINPGLKKIKMSNYSKKAQFISSISEKDQQSLKELYYSEVLEFDSYFGEFIDFLKAEGIYDQSMVVFVSDHGEEFYEHKGWFHGHSLYNELTNIPFIVKFPHGQFKGKKSENLIGLLDLFPTLMDYYKINFSGKIDGISLLPSIVSDKKHRDFLWLSTSFQMKKQLPPRIGYLFGNYKLIYNFPFTQKAEDFFSKYTKPVSPPEYELYDLKEDPEERHNLFSKQKNLDNILKEVALLKKKIVIASRKKSPHKIIPEKSEKDRLKTLGYL